MFIVHRAQILRSKAPLRRAQLRLALARSMRSPCSLTYDTLSDDLHELLATRGLAQLGSDSEPTAAGFGAGSRLLMASSDGGLVRLARIMHTRERREAAAAVLAAPPATCTRAKRRKQM